MPAEARMKSFFDEGVWEKIPLSTVSVDPLKFRDQNRAVFRVMLAAAAVQLGLLILLVPTLGATGAALAYALGAGFIAARKPGKLHPNSAAAPGS